MTNRPGILHSQLARHEQILPPKPIICQYQEPTPFRKEVLAHGQQLKEKAAPLVVEDSRAVRPRRPMRQTRLSTIQRLATAVEDVRRWLGLDQTEAVEQKETVAEKIGPTESVTQAEKIAPAVKETPGQKLRRELERSRQRAATTTPLRRHPHVTPMPNFDNDSCYAASGKYCVSVTPSTTIS